MSFKSTLLLLYSFYKPVKKLVIINIVWYFDHSNFNIFAIRVVQNYNTVRSEAKTFYDLFSVCRTCCCSQGQYWNIQTQRPKFSNMRKPLSEWAFLSRAMSPKNYESTLLIIMYIYWLYTQRVLVSIIK